MNKFELDQGLRKMDVKVKSFVFDFLGFEVVLEMKEHSPHKWDELKDYMKLEGYEVVRHIWMGGKNLLVKLIIIPTTAKEFNNYIERCINRKGVSRRWATHDLDCLIYNFGSWEARKNYTNYKKGLNALFE